MAELDYAEMEHDQLGAYDRLVSCEDCDWWVRRAGDLGAKGVKKDHETHEPGHTVTIEVSDP